MTGEEQASLSFAGEASWEEGNLVKSGVRAGFSRN